MQTLNTIFVGILTVLGVWFAWRQLRLAEAESVGRSTLISSVPLPLDAGQTDREYEIEAWTHGPATLHAARLDITNTGLEDVHSERLAKFDATSAPLELRVRLSDGQASNAWLVLSWGATRTTWLGRPMLVSEAVRTRINMWGEVGRRGVFETWKYRRPFGFWNYYENRRRRWLPGSGRRRPLGRYKPVVSNRRWLSQGPFADPTVFDQDS